MDTETSVRFNVSGEWLTQTVRDMFYMDKKPYKVVEEILLHSMMGSTFSDEELKYMAQDVLLGRAEFVGNTKDGTYSYIKTNSYDNTIFELFDKQNQKIQELEKENQEFCRKYLDLYDAIQDDSIERCEFNENAQVIIDWKRKYRLGEEGEREAVKEISCTYGRPKKSILDDFLEAVRYDDNYGFIKPDGTFVPVEFANHLDWAQNYVEENYLEDEYMKWSENVSCDSIYHTDYLIEALGFVLLHNPTQGLARVEISKTKNLTKKQKEFLFDYYTKRNEHEKAKEWLD